MELLKRIDNLIEVASTDDLDIIEDCIDSFPAYINSIVRMEQGIQLAKFRCYTQESYIEEVERLDRYRQLKHNSVISSVSILNRLCDLYEVEQIYQKKNKDIDDEVDNRIDIADFSKEVVDIYYNIRKKAS